MEGHTTCYTGTETLLGSRERVVDWAGGVGTQQKQITVVVFGEGGLRYASREYTDIRGWITQRS